MSNNNDNTLRPKKLADFTGQKELIKDINVMLRSAKIRNTNPDHILFSGPPGLGKTTLGEIISNELNLQFVATSAPTIEKPGDLIQLLINIKEPSLIFVDEIHGLDKKCEEMLYTALEDGHVDMVLGEGSKTRALRIKINPFTLVGATTMPGKISAPLRDRFGYQGRFKYYSIEDLTNISIRNAKILNISLSEEGAKIIASRSQGTPRIINNLLRRVRDFVTAENITLDIDSDLMETILKEYGIDNLGLDSTAREIIGIIINKFQGGPVGLHTLATALGEDTKTLETMYEPYLMRIGLINRTPQGRIATAAAYEHIKPNELNPNLIF